MRGLQSELRSRREERGGNGVKNLEGSEDISEFLLQINEGNSCIFDIGNSLCYKKFSPSR